MINSLGVTTKEVELFEGGKLSFEKTVDLFQWLSDTGKIWKMNNTYVVQMYDFIDNGYVVKR